MDTLERKRKDLEFGCFAESKATEFYISQGYAIRERNWRTGKIEIDIIAQKDNIVAFIEVKARSGKDIDAAESVSLNKMKSMARGADIYLRNLDGDFEYRFDIFALTGNMDDYSIELFTDAFISPLLR